jgi:predicted transcriptional regulator
VTYEIVWADSAIDQSAALNEPQTGGPADGRREWPAPLSEVRERKMSGVYVTHTRGMSDVMIRVPAEVRDQLAAVAEARGISLRALMRDLAAQTLTPEQLKERADRTRALLAEHFGHFVTDEESAEMRRRMREAAAAHRAFRVSPKSAL